MNYDVVWSPVAENELAAMWLDPGLRGVVTGASSRIDGRLERNAEDEGESRPGDHRIAFEPPIGVLFHVNAQTRRVTVVHVWAFET